MADTTEIEKINYEGIFEKPEFNTPEELLGLLRLSNPNWFSPERSENSKWVSEWYFRGQRDAEWPLIPSAWRIAKNESLELAKLDSAPYREVVTNAIEIVKQLRIADGLNIDNINWDRVDAATLQMLLELHLVREFIDLGDSIGHHIPASRIPPITQDIYVDTVSELTEQTSPNAMHKRIWFDPAIALAQHHRIPTRLLDFTRNPLAAAYFAASEVVESPPKSGHFAIYAFHTDSIPLSDLPTNPTSIYKWHVRRVQVSRSENEYLRAQEGVFVVDTNADLHYIETGHYPHLMESLYRKDGPPIEHRPIKFVIPATMAPELLRMLYLERMTKAHLMPTLDNAAQTIIKKWTWILALPHKNVRRWPRRRPTQWYKSHKLSK